MLVLPEKNALILTLRNPQRITALLPAYQQLNDNRIAVRHGLEEVKVLRNLGIDAPSPINTHYQYPGRYHPFVHQRETAAFLTLHNRCFVFNDMGLGKSLSALWAADYLMNEGLVRKALILSTMTCMETVWQAELFGNLPHRTAMVVHGTRKDRIKMLGVDVDVDCYIINHDGIRLPGIVEAIHKRGDVDLIIVDEAAVLRNSRTATYHAVKKLLLPHHRLWMLTGLPCPNGPMDAFGLGTLVSPDRLPRYFNRWQADTMIRLNQFKWVPKSDAMAKVYDALQPAIRFKKEDCLDLPPVIYMNRQTELSDEQNRAYKAMKEHLYVIQNNEPITAVNAAVKLGKLLQICSGAARTDTGDYAPIPCKPRMQALKEAVEEAQAKTVVFVPYTGALRAVVAFLEAEGYTVGMMDGSVTGRRRTEILNAFTGRTDPRILVANPDTASHGLNLTVADCVVWFAPIHSLDTYTQACERTNRPGQKNTTRIIHIGGTKLEWGVYEALKKKELRSEALMQMYVDEMRGVGL